MADPFWRRSLRSANYRPVCTNDGSDAVEVGFARITNSLAFLSPFAFYNGGDGNDVVLTLLTDAFSFRSAAVTRNQLAVAGALDQFPTDNPLFLAVLSQTALGARQAFDALSGEVHATVAGTLADDERGLRGQSAGLALRLSLNLDRASRRSEAVPVHTVRADIKMRTAVGRALFALVRPLVRKWCC